MGGFKSGQIEHDSAIIDEKTENAKKLLFQLENVLRDFVISQIGDDDKRIKKSFINDWKSSKKKEFTRPRKPLEYNLIYYSTFNQLKKIIIDNENWSQLFQKYFGRQEGIISRLHELDSIRVTLAHNRILSDFDFRSFKILYEQIMSCLPEGEKFLKDLNLEITLFEESRKESVLSQELKDITRLEIANPLLDSLYKTANTIALGIYYDAQLSGFAIQVFPYRSRSNIYLDFYSKWANKQCRFQYSCNSKEMRHITPDKPQKSNHQKTTFKILPWKKTPNWKKIIGRTYSKIGPLHPADETSYHLNVYPEKDIYWIITYEDGFNGNSFSFYWDGKGLNEKHLSQLT